MELPRATEHDARWILVRRARSAAITAGILWRPEGRELPPGIRIIFERCAQHRLISPTRCSRLRLYCVLGLLAASLGCSPAYVSRAGLEQLRIVWTRQPIDALLATSTLSAEERGRLELVRDVRTFAQEHLGLRVGGNYASFVRSRSTAALHVVTAAERFRLEPVSWWFPIVGRVPYKGYFDHKRAADEARRLERDGFDTRIFEAAAFSTLGWFDDPLFSNLLRLPDEALANLVLHELLHTTHFTPGHVAFAESFANFVGYRGAADFFARRGDDSSAARIEREWAAAIAFSDFLTSELDALANDYANGMTEAARQLRFRRIREAWANQADHEFYAGFSSEALNNASLLHLGVYHRDLRIFDRAWELYGNDLRATVDAVISATKVRRGVSDPYAAVYSLLHQQGLALERDQRSVSEASTR